MGNTNESLDIKTLDPEFIKTFLERMDPGDKIIVNRNIVNSPAWYARTLWEVAKQYPVQILTATEVETLYDQSNEIFIEFSEDDIAIAIDDVDLSFPIILTKDKSDNSDIIVDGYHRVYKARNTGQALKYVVLPVMPEPDILNNHHTKEALIRIEERVSKFD